MKIWLFLSVFLIVTERSHAQKRDCFRQHLLEAIKINQEAKSFYGELSKKTSDRIFRRLIRAERIGLIFAAPFDRKAQLYHKQGIPLFCDEFIPIPPSFTPPIRLPPPKEDFSNINWSDFRSDLNKAVDQGDFLEIQRSAMRGIKALEHYPQFYCMLRHVFESIYRISQFAPQRIEASSKLGLSSPKKIILKLIKLHVRSIRSSYEIDQWSAPLQLEGIPVLCHELPSLLNELNN